MTGVISSALLRGAAEAQDQVGAITGENMGVLAAASRRLMYTPFTSERLRVGSIGPGLFACIFFGVALALICCLAGYADKPKKKWTVRCIAFFALVIIPAFYFGLSDYENDRDKIVSDATYDSSFQPRFVLIWLCVITMISILCSVCCPWGDPVLLRELQGRAISYDTEVKHL